MKKLLLVIFVLFLSACGSSQTTSIYSSPTTNGYLTTITEEKTASDETNTQNSEINGNKTS